ncbi:MAG: DUF2314 domain-containing protein [Acidobacteriota bacterium]
MRKFIILLAFSMAACAADKGTLVPGSDPEMNSAILRARQTLDDFLAVKNKAPDGISGFVVKVRFEHGTAQEHMWVTPFRQGARGAFQGTLKSEPQWIPGLKLGQEVSFTRDQISDWGYNQGGTLVGYFTTCAMFAKDEKLRQQLKEQGYEYACAAY